MAIDAYIIMNDDNVRKMVHNLIKVHVKDVLRHLYTDRHVQEPVPVMVGFKGGQVGGFLIEVYVSEAVLSIQLIEASSTT